MEFPHPPYAMIHSVDTPLHKITQDKNQQELKPARQVANLYGHCIRNTKQS